MWNREDLKHVIQQAPGLYFVLPDALDRSATMDALKLLRAVGGSATPDSALERHWHALVRRSSGTARWDVVSPRYTGSDESPDGMREVHRRAPFFRNIVELREYTCFTASDIDYTLDLFNPANELDLPYHGAGETVVALLLGAGTPRTTQVGLIDNQDFYRIVRGLHDIFGPTHLCGIHSLASIVIAFDEGRVGSSTSPWDFLYPITVVTARESFPPMLELQRLFSRVDRWPDERLFLQVRKGLDAVMAPEYVAAGRAVGMVPVQEVVPGAYDRMPRRPRDLFRKGNDR
jgi:hypothetical protein